MVYRDRLKQEVEALERRIDEEGKYKTSMNDSRFDALLDREDARSVEGNLRDDSDSAY